ncbi:hypothetical protein ACP70R_046324 [Stipagrostis hirtigluma subsp. patula]
MVPPEDCSIYQAVGRHGIHDEATGSPLVGGVDFLATGTALFRDHILRPVLNSQQRLEAYLEFRDQAFKIAATQMVSTLKSPVDLLLLAKDDAEDIGLLHAEYIAFCDLRPFLGDESDGSLAANVSANPYKDRIKLFKDVLLRKLYHVRRYYVYRKGLLKLGFIEWNSDPEEVLRTIKASTRWSTELGDHELRRGLKSHMYLLKELEMSKVSSSKSALEKMAMEKINSELSSELEKQVSRCDYIFIDHVFERMRVMSLARECAAQAQTAGVILVEKALPIRQFSSKEPKLSTPNVWRLPYIKQTVMLAFEGSMGSLISINERFRAGAARVKAAHLLVVGSFATAAALANMRKE